MEIERARLISGRTDRYWYLLGILTCFILILVGTVSGSKAAPLPEINVAYFQDSTNRLTIEQVSANSFASQFQKSSSTSLNFGLSSDTYWLKVLIRRTSNAPEQWYLEVDYPPLDTVSFFTAGQEGVWELQQAGDQVLKNEQTIHYRKPLFHFELADTLWHTYYLKVQTQGTAQVPLKLINANQALSEIAQSELIEGLFYGAMLLMVLYNLFLFFSLKERSYLFYCLFVACNTFMLAGLQGQLTYRFSLYGWLFDRVFIASFFATVFWALIFAITFLRVRYFARGLFVILRGLTILSAIFCTSSFVLPYHVSATGVAGLVMITPFIVGWSGIVCWKQGNISARFFVLAWTWYLILVTLISLRNFGLMTEDVRLENLIQVGSGLEALLLSLALADQINLYRQRKLRRSSKLYGFH